MDFVNDILMSISHHNIEDFLGYPELQSDDVDKLSFEKLGSFDQYVSSQFNNETSKEYQLDLDSILSQTQSYGHQEMTKSISQLGLHELMKDFDVKNIIDHEVDFDENHYKLERMLITTHLKALLDSIPSDQRLIQPKGTSIRDLVQRLQEFLLQKANRRITEHTDYDSQCDENNLVKYDSSLKGLLGLPSSYTEALVDISSKISFEKETNHKGVHEAVHENSYCASKPEVHEKEYSKISKSQARCVDKLSLAHNHGAMQVQTPKKWYTSTSDKGKMECILATHDHSAPDLSLALHLYTYMLIRSSISWQFAQSGYFTKQHFKPSALLLPCSYKKQQYSVQPCTDQLTCNNASTLQGCHCFSGMAIKLQHKPEAHKSLPTSEEASVQSQKQLLTGNAVPPIIEVPQVHKLVACYSDQKSSQEESNLKRSESLIMMDQYLASEAISSENSDFLSLLTTCGKFLPTTRKASTVQTRGSHFTKRVVMKLSFPSHSPAEVQDHSYHTTSVCTHTEKCHNFSCRHMCPNNCTDLLPLLSVPCTTTGYIIAIHASANDLKANNIIVERSSYFSPMFQWLTNVLGHFFRTCTTSSACIFKGIKLDILWTHYSHFSLICKLLLSCGTFGIVAQCTFHSYTMLSEETVYVALDLQGEYLCQLFNYAVTVMKCRQLSMLLEACAFSVPQLCHGEYYSFPSYIHASSSNKGKVEYTLANHNHLPDLSNSSIDLSPHIDAYMQRSKIPWKLSFSCALTKQHCPLSAILLPCSYTRQHFDAQPCTDQLTCNEISTLQGCNCFTESEVQHKPEAFTTSEEASVQSQKQLFTSNSMPPKNEVPRVQKLVACYNDQKSSQANYSPNVMDQQLTSDSRSCENSDFLSLLTTCGKFLPRTRKASTVQAHSNHFTICVVMKLSFPSLSPAKVQDSYHATSACAHTEKPHNLSCEYMCPDNCTDLLPPPRFTRVPSMLPLMESKVHFKAVTVIFSECFKQFPLGISSQYPAMKCLVSLIPFSTFPKAIQASANDLTANNIIVERNSFFSPMFQWLTNVLNHFFQTCTTSSACIFKGIKLDILWTHYSHFSLVRKLLLSCDTFGFVPKSTFHTSTMLSEDEICGALSYCFDLQGEVSCQLHKHSVTTTKYRQLAPVGTLSVSPTLQLHHAESASFSSVTKSVAAFLENFVKSLSGDLIAAMPNGSATFKASVQQQPKIHGSLAHSLYQDDHSTDERSLPQHIHYSSTLPLLCHKSHNSVLGDHSFEEQSLPLHALHSSTLPLAIETTHDCFSDLASPQDAKMIQFHNYLVMQWVTNQLPDVYILSDTFLNLLCSPAACVVLPPMTPTVPGCAVPSSSTSTVVPLSETPTVPLCTYNGSVVEKKFSLALCSQISILPGVMADNFEGNKNCNQEILISDTSDFVVISVVNELGLHVVLCCISKLVLFYLLPSYAWHIQGCFSQEMMLIPYVDNDKLKTLSSLLFAVHTTMSSLQTPTFEISHSPQCTLKAQSTKSKHRTHLAFLVLSSTSYPQSQFSQQIAISSDGYQNGNRPQNQGHHSPSQSGHSKCNSSQGSSSGQDTSGGKINHLQDDIDSGNGNRWKDDDDTRAVQSPVTLTVPIILCAIPMPVSLIVPARTISSSRTPTVPTCRVPPTPTPSTNACIDRIAKKKFTSPTLAVGSQTSILSNMADNFNGNTKCKREIVISDTSDFVVISVVNETGLCPVLYNISKFSLLPSPAWHTQDCFSQEVMLKILLQAIRTLMSHHTHFAFLVPNSASNTQSQFLQQLAVSSRGNQNGDRSQNQRCNSHSQSGHSNCNNSQDSSSGRDSTNDGKDNHHQDGTDSGDGNRRKDDDDKTWQNKSNGRISTSTAKTTWRFPMRVLIMLLLLLFFISFPFSSSSTCYINETVLQPLLHFNHTCNDCQDGEVRINSRSVLLMMFNVLFLLLRMCMYVYNVYKAKSPPLSVVVTLFVSGHRGNNQEDNWCLFLSLILSMCTTFQTPHLHSILFLYNGIFILATASLMIALFIRFLYVNFSSKYQASNFDPGGSNKLKQRESKQGDTHLQLPFLVQADVNQMLHSEGSEMVLNHSFKQHVCSSMRCGKDKVREESSPPGVYNSKLVVHAQCPFQRDKTQPLTSASPSTHSITVLTTSIPQQFSSSQGVNAFNGIVEGCNDSLLDLHIHPAQSKAVTMTCQNVTGITQSSAVLSYSSNLKHFVGVAEESSYLFPSPCLTSSECQEQHNDFMHSAFASNSNILPITNYLSSLSRRGRYKISSSLSSGHEHGFITSYEDRHQREGNEYLTCDNLPPTASQDHETGSSPLNGIPATVTTSPSNTTNCKRKPTPTKRHVYLLVVPLLVLLLVTPCGQAMSDAAEASRSEIQFMFHNATPTCESTISNIVTDTDKKSCSVIPLHSSMNNTGGSIPTSNEINRHTHSSPLPFVFITLALLQGDNGTIISSLLPFSSMSQARQKKEELYHTNNTAMMVHPQFSLSGCKDLVVVPVDTCESMSLPKDYPLNITTLLLVVMLDRYAKGQDHRQSLSASHLDLRCNLTYHEGASMCPLQTRDTTLKLEFTFSLPSYEEASNFKLKDVLILMELLEILILVYMLFLLIFVNKPVKCFVRHDLIIRNEPLHDPLIYDNCPYPHLEYEICRGGLSDREGVVFANTSVLAESLSHPLVVANQHYPLVPVDAVSANSEAMMVTPSFHSSVPVKEILNSQAMIVAPSRYPTSYLRNVVTNRA